MLVIPAIDIKEGKVVRLERGDFQKPTLYFDNPLEAAVYWENEGAEFLHIVDLDGAREGAPKNLNLIKEIARKIKVPIQAGGGIRTRKEIDQLLQSGIERVIVGTKACADRDWLRKIGKDFSGKIVVSLDVKDDFLAVEGWLKGTALKPVEFVENLKGLGVDTFIFTDIERDGTLSGLRIDYLSHFLSQTKVKIMVAGGVGSLEDIKALSTFSEKGVIGVIVGKALYEKRFTLREAMEIVR